MDYSSTQKGYIIYDTEFDKFIINIDVIFRETIFPVKYPKNQLVACTDLR